MYELQQSICRTPGRIAWLVALTVATAGGALVAADRPSLAQAEVVSTATETVLRVSSERSVVGARITLTADVAAVHARAAVPGGFIDFYDETTARTLGRADAVRPSVTVSDLSPGPHVIRAYYRGTSDFMPAIVQPSLSQSVELHVLAPPQLRLSAAWNGGDAVDLTAQVTGKGAAPRGTITFRDGASVLAAAVQLDASGQASFMTSALSEGSHTFFAEYSGDAIYAPATASAPKRLRGAANGVLHASSDAARD